jgi:hypothetical protein
MEWDKLSYDNRSGVHANAVTIMRPSWAQVEDAIKALDGEKRTDLLLSGKDGLGMVIAGGPVKFVVSASLSEEEIYTLKDKSRPDTTVMLTAGGQLGAFSEQEVWQQSAALQAAHYFYLHGINDLSLPWERVGESG